MTSATSAEAFTCSETACEIATGEPCLEGFDPHRCPHAAAALDAIDVASDVEPSEAKLEVLPAVEDFQEVAAQDVDLVAVPGDEALTLTEVGDLMARHPVNLVLIAGEAKVGKTTLVAELFARFLSGSFGPWAFGGSETLRAFHIRLYPSLADSGAGEPTTERTADEDMRFLHMCLAYNGQRQQIVASDGKGEYFKNLIDHGGVATEVPIASRADRCVLAVDGERLNDPKLRDSTLSRSRLLLRALAGPGGLSDTCPVAILCTKWDGVAEQNREGILNRLKTLAKVHSGDTVVLTSSVRPGPPIADIDGLSELLNFLALPPTAGTAQPTHPAPPVPEQGRHYWRVPVAATEDRCE